MQKIEIAALKNLLFQASKKFISNEEAHYYTQENLEILLRKSNEVETGWIEQIVHDLEEWNKLKDKKFQVISETDGVKLIDCNDLPAALKLKEIHDDLELRAKKLGVAITGLIHLGGDDALSIWTNNLAKRDLIALCFVNGGTPTVVPYGGMKAMLGVNPMSYAIPTLSNPIIADFATSQLANYRVMGGVKNNEKINIEAVVDKEGNPTKDLQKGVDDKNHVRYLPMGGNYKGYEIVFLVEVLTGALIQSKMGSLEHSDQYISTECGELIIAIDISSFTDINKFKESVSNMSEEIRKQKNASFVDKITVPGDRSYERMMDNLNKGFIEITEEQIKMLEELTK